MILPSQKQAKVDTPKANSSNKKDKAVTVTVTILTEFTQPAAVQEQVQVSEPATVK